MEDILLLDSVINCLSISSNDFCCGCSGALALLRGVADRSLGALDLGAEP